MNFILELTNITIPLPWSFKRGENRSLDRIFSAQYSYHETLDSVRHEESLHGRLSPELLHQEFLSLLLQKQNVKLLPMKSLSLCSVQDRSAAARNTFQMRSVSRR